MLMKMPHRRFLFLLTVLLGIEFAALAIAPNDRKDWLLENVLVVLFVGAMFASYRKLMLSRISYLLIFLFLSLHLVGAHYTYAQVPYDRWFESLTGRTLNSLVGWERNNFDRVVHFSYACCWLIRCAKYSSGSPDCAASGVIFSRWMSRCPRPCCTN